MKNFAFANSLPEGEKEKFLDTYANHPLADYIDWEAFYRSEDGNEMHFLKYLRKGKNENEFTVYVLKEIDENEEDYEIIYDTELNELQKRPVER